MLTENFAERGGGRRHTDVCQIPGSPQRPALWGEEEPRYEVKAYLPDMPTEYSVRRRNDVMRNFMQQMLKGFIRN